MEISYKLKDIVHELKNHWVLQVANGYEVYKTGVTHSTRCAVIGFTGEIGKNKAIAECNRRESLIIV